MDNLNPTAQAVYDALADRPGTVTELRARSRKSEAAVNKAVRLLFAAGLIVNATPDADTAQWQRTDGDQGDAAAADAHDGDVSAGGRTGEADADPVEGDPVEHTPLGDVDDPAGDTTAGSIAEQPEGGTLGDDPRVPGDEVQPGGTGAPDGTETPSGETGADVAAEEGPNDSDGDVGERADGAATVAADGEPHEHVSDGDGEPAAAVKAVPPPDPNVYVIAGALGEYPDGVTVEDLAAASGLSLTVVTGLLKPMGAADAARRIPADPEAGTPERWVLGDGRASEVDTTPPPRCPECGQELDGPAPDTSEDGPRRPDPDVLAIVGVLREYPDGATFDEISDAVQLQDLRVRRLLRVMQVANVATFHHADADGDVSRWMLGTARAADARPDRCPDCGKPIPVRPQRRTLAARTPNRTGDGGDRVNSDGSPGFRKGELLQHVKDYFAAHSGVDLTPGVITEALAVQLSRSISDGAVRNNCTTLAATGVVLLVSESPLTFRYTAES